MNNFSPDCFPCLLISADIETHRVIYTNEYANNFLGIEPDSHISIFDFLSKASWIFFESYIRPTIIKDKECMEVQITLVNKDAKKKPAVANITLVDSCLHWSIYSAEVRDKLYEELLSTREHLESQNEKLLTLTRVDPLTSLLNRRAATNDFIQMTKMLARTFVPISFLLMDIDWFKNINDSYGHDKGDEIIIKISNLIKKFSRDTDIVARWGGEEFLIILYNTSISSSELFCSRLHELIQTISLPDNEVLTVSIGVTSLNQKELTVNNLLDKIINRADKALYLAKNNGRSRTEIII